MIRFRFLPLFVALPGLLSAAGIVDPTPGTDELPKIPEGFEIKLVAREPLVRQPCSMAFDARGRLFVGMGPQYRNPKPDTPGDTVVLLEDTDGDGVFDRAKVFASGLNCVQSLAWHGRDLWIANSPDLTVVRDLDGDDVADEYVKVYTDLGNIEHALHGLNWAPDGKLYMSKGNSKGSYDPKQPDRVAPRAFRELSGIPIPADAPEIPAPQTFKPGDYHHTYHDPNDDWGMMGGIYRCEDGGKKLEIVSRGLRNPWDITFDTGFNWLGTDNDQTGGDKVIMPFHGAHFGWGHSWCADWSATPPLPETPASGKLFEGSGTGIIFCDSPAFPEKYRHVFFINDWLSKTTFLYRPCWDGALLQPQDGDWEPFLRGTKALYRPTDIEVGPDGAIYILGWSSGYGAEWKNGQLTNEGRIFRLNWKSSPPLDWHAAKRSKPLAQWSTQELVKDFGGPLPVWRIDAQDELVRRGAAIKSELVKLLVENKTDEARETWIAWTLGRIAPDDSSIDEFFAGRAADAKAGVNLRLQSIRILAHRIRNFDRGKSLPDSLAILLRHPEPRIRFEVVQAAWQARQVSWTEFLKLSAAVEKERLTFFALWHTLADFTDANGLRAMLKDSRGGVRCAALLGLLESGKLAEEEVRSFLKDPDASTSSVAALWISKHQQSPLITFKPEGREFDGTIDVKLTPNMKPADLRYTIDGSEPTAKSSKAKGAIHLEHSTTLKARLFVNGEPMGQAAVAGYRKAGENASLLKPLAAVTTMDQVMPLVTQGDAVQGRKLFLAPGGAGCFNCHRVGKEGISFAPDLSGIGSRADAHHIVQSMLDPSAVITEGFNTHLVESTQGSWVGILLEESGLDLTLGLMNGQRQRIPKEKIKKHEALPASAMPPFMATLAPQQCADITAWLLEQKLSPESATESTKTKVSKKKSKDKSQPDSAAPSATSATSSANSRGFAFTSRDDRIVITHDGKPVTDYIMRDAKVLRPYFVRACNPAGRQVTRNYPPIPGKDATDHDTMHPGIAYGFGDINGVDFWHNGGTIRHERFLEPAGIRDQALRFVSENSLVAPERTVMGKMIATVQLSTQSGGYLLDWMLDLVAGDKELVLGDQEEMGFAVRVATPLTEKNGGHIESSSEFATAKKTWGKEANWCDYHGKMDGADCGIAVFASPENFRPSWWHNRDYGLFVANAFGRKAMKQGSASRVEIKPGQTLRLHYAAWLHDASDSDTIAKIYQAWIKESSTQQIQHRSAP